MFQSTKMINKGSQITDTIISELIERGNQNFSK